ncbi:MAG: glycosyltransferase family 39 protein [Armatimonadota bacterium]
MKKEKSLHPSLPDVWAWVILAGVILFTVVCRVQMLSFPLERDEGEYAYAGQLILQGIPPYSIACNMKLPGTCLMYALIMLAFPQTSAGIHLGLLLFNLASILLVFLVARRLFGNIEAIISAAIFAFLSLNPLALALQAHATHFIVFFSLLGILLLLRAIDTGRPVDTLLSGLLFGMAFIMKQQAAPIVLFGLIYLVIMRRNFKESVRHGGIFIAGAVIPFAAVCIWLLAAGVFHNFWFWTFKYASQYASRVPVSAAYGIFLGGLESAVGVYKWLWLLGAIGIVAPIWDKSLRKHSFFAAGFLLFTFISVCPGFYFRPHYFITMFPALAISAAIFITSVSRLILRWSYSKIWILLSFAITFVLLVQIIIPQWNFFFYCTPSKACRIIYSANPFPEAVVIADYIKANTRPNDTIAIIGSEPEICFYSRRHSATEFMYVYSLFEKGNRYTPIMRRMFCKEMINSRPSYILFVHNYASFLADEAGIAEFMSQCEPFINKYYKPAGLVDMISPMETEYYWGDKAACLSASSNYYIRIYKRTDYKGPADH